MNNKIIMWVLLILLSITWGSSFILIKKGLENFTPYQVGAYRVFLSALLLTTFGFKHLKSIAKKDWVFIFIAGLLGSFFPMFLFPMAEVKIDSAIAGVLNALVPLFVILFSVLFFRKSANKQQVVGVVLGLVACIFLIMNGKSIQQDLGDLYYAGLILLATMMYAMNALLVKYKLGHIPSVKLTTAIFSTLLIPSFILLIVSGFFEIDFQQVNNLSSLGYVSILSIFGTAIANLLFYRLISISSVVFSSSVTYIMPIISIFWGLVAGEIFNVFHFLSTMLIIFSVYIINYKKEEKLLN